VLTTFSSRSPRALFAAFITAMVVIAPLPLSVSHTANAAAIPVASGTWSQGNQIQLIFGYSLATANPPALTSFDVRVDDVANPVTAISFLGTILYLTLTSTVYSGSVIKVSYSAPAVDNTTNNAALQSSSGNDTESFPNLLINNDAGPKPVPNKPGVPSVVAGEESATITVTAPSGGVTPTSYEVTATPGGAKCTVTGASGSCTISGLTAGTAYTFTTVAKRSGFDSPASAASASVTALAKIPSWDKEPLTDSETDSNTVGYMPTTSPGNIIITDEFGFTLDKNNGIKPKIRMKNYAGKIKMSISATYKVGAKNVKYKCAFKPFGTTKKIKTAKWRWYAPKKACVLPAPLVAAIRANKATLSTSGKWTRQALTTGKKVRADNSKIKARNLKYKVKAKL
jgi:hypothetical protein